MSEALFVAPPGAMQFEVTSFLDGSAPDGPLVVWVKPLERRNYVDKGGCVSGYPIIIESLRSPYREMTERQMAGKFLRRPSVCRCLGRIVE